MAKYSVKPLVVLAAAGTLSAHLGAAWLASDLGLSEKAQPDEPLMFSVLVADAEKPAMPAIAVAKMPENKIREVAVPMPPAETVTAQTPPAPEVAKAEPPQAEPLPPAVTPETPAKPMAAPLKSGALVFDVYLGAAESDPLARMTHELKFTDQTYEISSRGEALGLLASLYSGLLTQRSVGLMTETGFSPQQYSEQKGKKPESITVFDQKTASIQFSGSAGQPLPEHAQDRLSVIYALTAQLKDSELMGSLPKQGDVIKFKVANTQSIEDFDFDCLGYEPVVLRHGEVRAMRFKRTKNVNGEKSSIELWFSPATEWLPVQIRLTDKKGMVVTQRLHN